MALAWSTRTTGEPYSLLNSLIAASICACDTPAGSVSADANCTASNRTADANSARFIVQMD